MGFGNNKKWHFLEAMLLKLGFAQAWVTQIMLGVTSVQYPILLNGKPAEVISPSRGIRQGDPLSPYLFILCAEGLSSLISKAVADYTIKGLKLSPQAPILHHLFFADDSFIFGAAEADECQKFRTLLNLYESASGQKINYQKSSVVFSRNVSPEIQSELAAILQVKLSTEHDRYLGLPLRVGRSKTQIFAYIKEKFSNKLLGWKAKLFSVAGKEVLIKAVAQTMPLYAMNCYLLPKTLCEDIHQLCAGFFGGDEDNKKKIHWRSWERMCLTKNEGGLGFKHLYAYNLAMLAKQAWRLVKFPNSLVDQVFKARYYPYCSFWEAQLSEHPSFSWRSIFQSRPVLEAGIQWKIGDGAQINIWNDAWIPNCPKYLIHKPNLCQLNLVQDLIDPQSRTWNTVKVQQCFPNAISQKILCIPLSNTVIADRLTWKQEKRGKVLICAWRACNNILPIRARLTTKGYTGPVKCVSCPHKYEDIAHIMCGCPLAKDILSRGALKLSAIMSPIFDFKEWMLEQALSLSAEKFAKLLMVLWGLWRNRNNTFWSQKPQSAADILCGTMAWYHEFVEATEPLVPKKNQQTRPRWSPPAVGVLKLNVDGAFLHNNTDGGIGGILRNSHDHAIAAFAYHLTNVTSPKQVELEAIRTVGIS
ncbi:hypothetical protein ACLB2K_036573 [Fragaria x ananassa]